MLSAEWVDPYDPGTNLTAEPGEPTTEERMIRNHRQTEQVLGLQEFLNDALVLLPEDRTSRVNDRAYSRELDTLQQNLELVLRKLPDPLLGLLVLVPVDGTGALLEFEALEPTVLVAGVLLDDVLHARPGAGRVREHESDSPVQHLVRGGSQIVLVLRANHPRESVEIDAVPEQLVPLLLQLESEDPLAESLEVLRELESLVPGG